VASKGHLICDGPSDIALGFEREEGVMDDSPIKQSESILGKRGMLLIHAISLSSAAVALFLFWYFWKVDGDVVSERSIVFTILAIQDLIYIFSYRSVNSSIFNSKHFFANTLFPMLRKRGKNEEQFSALLSLCDYHTEAKYHL